MSTNTQAVIDGYIECAFWASTDDDDTPLDQDHDVDSLNFASLALIQLEVERFLADNPDDCEEFAATYRPVGGYDPWECLGHDLWLTRNHHGAGFWDRGLGDLGDRLTDAAHALGEVHLYVGDDGQIYHE